MNTKLYKIAIEWLLVRTKAGWSLGFEHFVPVWALVIVRAGKDNAALSTRQYLERTAFMFSIGSNGELSFSIALN